MDCHPRCFAFIFPAIPGHVNPSLALARRLVQHGHQVHYLCADNLQKTIESTGAIFHSNVLCQPELYHGRSHEPPLGALGSTMKEFHVEVQGTHFGATFIARSMVANVMLEMQLPGTLRFLREVKPHVVVYDPMIVCRDGLYAAQLLGLPSVGLLTVAGPGAYAAHMLSGSSSEEFIEAVKYFPPHVASTTRLNAKFGLNLPLVSHPVAKLDPGSKLILVTTSEALQDKLSEQLAVEYFRDGTNFEYVGPLLDSMGASRAGAPWGSSMDLTLAAVQSARRTGQRVVLVSMGTILTSSVPHGWEGRPIGQDGQSRGLTGRELCRAAWAGAFDAASMTKDPELLLVVALGTRPHALGDLVPPPNAMVVPSVPQVDVLRAGVDVFVTHGGQNSFTEAIANATPVVVCPGFGDQIINSHKTVALGVGVKVDRPDPDAGKEIEAIEKYRKDVCASIHHVLDSTVYAEAAARCSEGILAAGAVPRAVELLLSASHKVQETEVLLHANAGA